MSPRYVVIGLVAVLVISLLVMKNVETWTRPIETAPERTSAKKQEAKAENPPAARPQKVEGSEQPYVAIAGKNIFSPDRKDFPVQAAGGAKPIVRPQVVLYGVTIGDGFQFASIVNPGRRLLRGERETMSVKVGEKIGDYKLAKIASDRITLEAEGDVFEVLLYDPKSPKRRSDVRTATAPPPVPAAPAAPSAAHTQPAQQVPPRVASPPAAAAPAQQLPAYDYRRSRRPFMVPSPAAPPGGAPPGTTPPGATPPAQGQPQGTGGH